MMPALALGLTGCVGLAAIILLLLLVGTIVTCAVCHRVVSLKLQKPQKPAAGPKAAKKGRYRGMKEFEMPEMKGNSWGIP